jgi:hypothetical protein
MLCYHIFILHVHLLLDRSVNDYRISSLSQALVILAFGIYRDCEESYVFWGCSRQDSV